MERSSSGLAALASAYAALRAGDGECDARGRYVSLISSCTGFTPGGIAPASGQAEDPGAAPG